MLRPHTPTHLACALQSRRQVLVRWVDSRHRLQHADSSSPWPAGLLPCWDHADSWRERVLNLVAFLVILTRTKLTRHAVSF